ncbi:MAG: hypothetical protein MJZ31_12030 [Bacteroidales bacterium]|nr:hypothetical protein [Bacteroidales bacterium]
MKNNLTRLLLLMSITGLIAITSCKKDDPEPEPEPIEKPIPTPDPEKPDPKPDPKPAEDDTVKIVSYKIIKQNLITESKATMEVTFNRPVTVTNLIPRLDDVDIPFLVDYEMSKDGLKMTTGPLGFYHMTDRKFEIGIVAKDLESGRPWGSKIKFTNFKNSYVYEGMTETVITDYERETIWMATKFPHRVYRIAMSDPEHPAYTDFDLCPNVITINPYNGYLYVGSTVNSYDEAAIYDRKVHVLDATTLKEVDSFIVSFDHTSMFDSNGLLKFPDATPISMAFTDDGYGIIVRQIYGSNGTGLCYVDSKNGHELTIDNCWEEFYSTVDQSYDKKQLIIKRDRFMSSDLYFVSRDNPTLKEYVVANQYKSDDPSAGGTLVAYKFHRSEPKYFIHDVSTMCIIDYETDEYSPVFTMVGNVVSIDFDYNNDNFAFKVDQFNGAYYYVDMNTGTPIYGCKYVLPLESGDIMKYMTHNPIRDELYFFELPPDRTSKTHLIVFDAKEFRAQYTKE